jgi:hypothetical protein
MFGDEQWSVSLGVPSYPTSDKEKPEDAAYASKVGGAPVRVMLGACGFLTLSLLPLGLSRADHRLRLAIALP